jgi:hypothetical protein
MAEIISLAKVREEKVTGTHLWSDTDAAQAETFRLFDSIKRNLASRQTSR